MPNPVSDQANCFVDVHCHRPTPGVLTIVNLDSRYFDKLPSADQPFSAGIHPWFINPSSLAQDFQHLQSIAAQSHLLAIGECGLDRCIDIPLPLQIQVFSQQLVLAERLGKPVIVHCVRAFGELLQLKKQLRPRQPWIVHGFRGKAELARQLLHHDCYLSFGNAICLDRQTIQALAATPVERLFLETDDAEDVSIGEIHAAAAKILDLDIPNLQRRIVANFNRVFA